MARTVTTFFNMKENYSSGMRRAATATSKFQSQVTAAARVLDRENKKRREIKIQNRKATGAIAEVSAQMKKIKDLRINITARTQNFKRDMKPVTNDIKNLVKKPLLVTLKLKDMALAGLRKAGDMLKTLAKGATIALGIAGGAMGYTLGKGATLQQYQASIEHNVFSANRSLTESQVQAQAKAYAGWLTQFAAKTTASVDDIFAGGAHALAGTGGDVSAAKGILKTAQDMAAQRPGASTWDAVEAILDMSLGQYRRITEFSFKVNADAMEGAGGDPFKVKDQNGRTLTERFGGAEARKAGTASGIWDSIKGTVEGGIMQAGSNILDALKPTLLAMLPYADTVAAKMGEMGTSIGGWISDTIPKLGELWDALKKNMEPLLTWFNDKWAMLQPFRDFAANAFGGMNIDGEKVLGGMTGAIDQLANTLISWLNNLATNWSTIEPVIAGIVQYLPQIALAFAGLKVISWGATTGKAIGNLFGGAGKLIGNLFGRGAATTPAVTPDTVLGKPGTTPKVGAKTNTFTGPNYNNFQGPNYNTNNGTGFNPPGNKTFFLPPVPGKSGGVDWGQYKLPDPGQQYRIGSGEGDSGKSGIIDSMLAWLATQAMKIIPAATAMAPGMPVIADWLQRNWGGIVNYPQQVANNIKALFPPQLGGRTGLLGTDAKSMPIRTEFKPLSGWQQLLLQSERIIRYIDIVPRYKNLGGTNWADLGEGPIGGAGNNVLQKQAAGIKRVPWDNYPAMLHKGETVLPSGEAGEYRASGNSSGSGMSLNGVVININGANKDGRQLAAELIRELRGAAFNMA